MNAELIPKAGQQNRSGTIRALKVTVEILQRALKSGCTSLVVL